MTTQLRTILDELYELDPALKQQEKELIPILETLLKHKPDAEPDSAFVQKLRMLLKERAASTTATHSPALRSFGRSEVGSFFTFFSMNKFTPAIAGVLLGVLVTGPVVYSLMNNGSMPALQPEDDSNTSPLFSYSVEKTSDRAFGDFDGTTANQAMGLGGGGAETMSARPQSGGGGGDPSIDSKMMIYPPEITEYNLVFEGQMPALTETEVAVLERQKNMSAADVSALLKGINLGLIDLEKFSNAKADSISFYEDKSYGQFITVNFREGAVYMNANWEKWPHPESNCQTEECFNRYRVKESELPADDVLIGLANDFVRSYNIDLKQYGNPEVDNNWRVLYDASPDKSSFYIPDVARVVYPLMIEGKPVFDEGGGKVGISIGINVREKKVSDAWGIMDQKYLSSQYAAVTDASSVTSFLQNYGKVNWEMPADTKKTTVNVTLGTPTIGYTKVYSYENATSRELIVPALIFPVTNTESNQGFYRTSITVPLAKQLLEKAAEGYGPVMPLMREAAM